MQLKDRFRGFLPVVIDLETGGLNPTKNPILELCIVLPRWEDDKLICEDVHHWHVAPHPDTHCEERSLALTGIDPTDPDREAVSEAQALGECLRLVRKAVRDANCTRAILTAHNAHFDQGFLKAAIHRSGIKRDPFHLFSVIDTVSLCGVYFGQTVLRFACREAGIEYEMDSAHSARYDALIVATIFAQMVNNSPFFKD
ncbi:MAG: exonuclease domain-containing protein [Gammaproteobacteria bacterium]|nr:exonuclease domain-containing protein [Gammaproteobacteria bacterium]